MVRNSEGKNQRPSIGIGVYIINEDGKVLLGKRKSSHGEGEYAPPGGHLEFGESFEEAAHNEVEEETGLDIEAIELFFVDNNLRYIKSDGKHYVTLSFKTKYLGGEPEMLEPHKCESWDWYSPDSPPSPLAEFAERALKNFNNKP